MSASELHVGCVLPTREAMCSGSPASLARFARRAEERGVESLWAGDSLLARPLYDPFTVLATAAAVTTSCLLGTGVLVAPMRPPLLAAQAISSLDQLSGGRLVVGVGQGFDLPETRREFAAAGAEFAHRTRRLVDTIALWRTLWSPPGRASMHAPYCELDDEVLLPRPARVGGPPLWLAGFGPAAFARAGRLADGWLPYPPDPEDYRAGLDAVREAALDAGRDPASITPAVMVTINVGEPASAAAALEHYVEEFYGYPLEVVSLIQACRSGPAADVLARLHEYWEAGARTFVLRLGSLDRLDEQLHAVGTTLLPTMRTWTDPSS